MIILPDKMPQNYHLSVTDNIWPRQANRKMLLNITDALTIKWLWQDWFGFIFACLISRIFTTLQFKPEHVHIIGGERPVDNGHQCWLAGCRQWPSIIRLPTLGRWISDGHTIVGPPMAADGGSLAKPTVGRQRFPSVVISGLSLFKIWYIESWIRSFKLIINTSSWLIIRGSHWRKVSYVWLKLLLNAHQHIECRRIKGYLATTLLRRQVVQFCLHEHIVCG